MKTKLILSILLFAFITYNSAAQEKHAQFDSDKNFSMGQDYFFGANGKPKNWKKAVSYYKKSVATGEGNYPVKSMFNIAAIYETGGNGIKKSITESKKWYTKACNAGDKDACDMLKRLD